MEKYRLVRAKYFGSREFHSHDWSKGAFLVVSINNRQFRNEHSLIQIFNTFKDNVGEGEFKILIGDYLDRHNEMIFNDYNLEKSIKTSIKKGDELIYNMENVLTKLNISNYTFIRTESFHHRNNYSELFNKYKIIYQNNMPFKNLIDKTIEQFFTRMKLIKTSKIKQEKGVNYLLEELVIFEMMIADGDFINVYPGKHLQILKKIVKEKIEIPTILKNYLLVELNFIKIK